MNNKNNRLTIRISQDFDKQLKDLCALYNLNKTQVLERLVNAEWLRSTEMGKAKIKQITELFNTTTETINNLEGLMNVR